MAIDFEREEYAEHAPRWRMVDACCDERGLGDLLLPINPHDKGPENKQRNKEYRERAVWFGASAFTEAGLVGTAFDDAPQIELPAMLEDLRENCDGQGVDLQQQMQATLSQVLRKGRSGLLVTYPQSEGDTSVAEKDAGEKRATIQQIDALRVINWWTESIGSKVVLAGVVFRDSIETVEDFAVKRVPILRSLTLEDGGAVDRKWKQKEGGSTAWEIIAEAPILDAAGNPWRELPFCFVGAFDNTASIDRAPLWSLARLNRAHFQNSADFEEACFFSGNPQPWVTGWVQEDVDTAKEGGFYLGSRQVIVADNFQFAQAEANTMARQAMLDKQDQMKAIGARFLEPGSAGKTATEASGDQKVQHSILSLAAANVEDAYNKAIRFCAAYEGSEEGKVTMSREYMHGQVAVEKVNAFLAAWDRGLVGPSEAHRVLTGANIVDPDKTAEDYAEELDGRGAVGGLVTDDASTD